VIVVEEVAEVLDERFRRGRSSCLGDDNVGNAG
jgi:hypothetical protein